MTMLNMPILLNILVIMAVLHNSAIIANLFNNECDLTPIEAGQSEYA